MTDLSYDSVYVDEDMHGDVDGVPNYGQCYMKRGTKERIKQYVYCPIPDPRSEVNLLYFRITLRQ